MIATPRGIRAAINLNFRCYPMDDGDDNPPREEDLEKQILSDSEGLSVDDGDALEIADEDLVSDDEVLALNLAEGAFRRPGIGASLLWTFLLLGSQVVVGLLMATAALFLVILSQHGPLDPKRLQHLVEKALSSWMLPIASFSTLLFSFVLVLVIFRRQTARCMGFRAMSVTQTVLVLLISLPMTVLTSEFTNWISYLFPRMQMPEMFADFATQPFLLIFAAGCLFPGVGEELFFRGFLSRGLVSRNGIWWGTFFTAGLFGAVHLHPIQASGAFLLGLVLQYVFLATQSLWSAILLHTANNSLAFLAMKYGDRVPIKGFTVASETETLHSPLLLVLAAMMTVAVLLIAIYQSRSAWEGEDGSAWSPGYVTAEGPVGHADVSLSRGSLDIVTWSFVLQAYAAFGAALYFSIGQ